MIGFEARVVIETLTCMNEAFPRIIGYNVREDGGPFEFVPVNRFAARTAAYELKLLRARQERAKTDLKEARRLRRDIDALIEKLEGEAG